MSKTGLRRVAAVGAGMTKFMRRALETPNELAYGATSAALESAEMTRQDIESVVIGTAPDAFDGIHMNGEYLTDGAGGLGLPTLRGYVGGGTGVFSVIQGWYMVASGVFDTCMVMCEEKMSPCQPHPQGLDARRLAARQILTLPRIQSLVVQLDPSIPSDDQLPVPHPEGSGRLAPHVPVGQDRRTRRLGLSQETEQALSHELLGGRHVRQFAQSRRQVHMPHGRTHHSGLQYTRVAQDQRHVRQLLVHRVAVLVAAVIPELLAVVGGQGHHRVVRETEFRQTVEQAADL